jgi:hypothetical protein
VPGIHEVAGEALTSLLKGDGLELIRIRLGPGATLPDHASGPRVIVSLGALRFARVASPEAEPLEVEPLQTMWLSNEHSAGIRNVGSDDAVYVALLVDADPSQHRSRAADCGATEPPARVLLDHERVLVCHVVLPPSASGLRVAAGAIEMPLGGYRLESQPSTPGAQLRNPDRAHLHAHDAIVRNPGPDPAELLLFYLR